MKLNELSIEIIETCPNNCLFCSSKSSMESKIMLSIETIKTVISDAKLLGIKHIHLSGGEPFMHPDIVDIVRNIKLLGFDLNIYSSGIIINDGKYSSIGYKILQELKSLGLNKIIFDVQAASNELYNQLMGTTEQFPNLILSIQNASKAGLTIEFHYIPTKLNEKDFRNVLDFARTIGATGLSVLRFVNQGRGRENQEVLEMSMEELISFRNYAKSLTEEYPDLKIRIGHPMLLDNKVTHLCTAGVGKLVITPKGLVYPCEAYKWMRGIFYQEDFMEGYFEPDSIHEFSLSTIHEKSWFLRTIRKDIAIFKGVIPREANEIFIPFSRETIPCKKISHFERKLYKKEGCLLCNK